MNKSLIASVCFGDGCVISSGKIDFDNHKISVDIPFVMKFEIYYCDIERIYLSKNYAKVRIEYSLNKKVSFFSSSYLHKRVYAENDFKKIAEEYGIILSVPEFTGNKAERIAASSKFWYFYE